MTPKKKRRAVIPRPLKGHMASRREESRPERQGRSLACLGLPKVPYCIGAAEAHPPLLVHCAHARALGPITRAARCDWRQGRSQSGLVGLFSDSIKSPITIPIPPCPHHRPMHAMPEAGDRILHRIYLYKYLPNVQVSIRHIHSTKSCMSPRTTHSRHSYFAIKQTGKVCWLQTQSIRQYLSTIQC